uniref:hypothetical protein n=1 Tax=Candidatus Tripitaka californicus TaxID=3367616 RepID=UPI0040269E2F
MVAERRKGCQCSDTRELSYCHSDPDPPQAEKGKNLGVRLGRGKRRRYPKRNKGTETLRYAQGDKK